MPHLPVISPMKKSENIDTKEKDFENKYIYITDCHTYL